MEKIDTKLYVLTGFLGSGKTTVLLKLLQVLQGQKIGIIQNEFGKLGIDGTILTKMDGTAKGGTALAVQSELGIPVKYIGTGEKATYLRRFDAKEYVDSILAD